MEKLLKLAGEIRNLFFTLELSSFLTAYAGEENEFIRRLADRDVTAKRFSPEAYIENVGTCDVMKCDIEGAEYSLITPSATWLRRVEVISLEYHGSWADGERLVEIIERHGSEVTQRPHGELGYLDCKRLQ